jgi:hypothetical protein
MRKLLSLPNTEDDMKASNTKAVNFTKTFFTATI